MNFKKNIKTIIRVFSNNSVIYLFVSGLFFSIFAQPFLAISYSVCLLGYALLLPIKQLGIVSRYVLAFLSTACLIMLCGLFAWVGDININGQIILVVLNVIGLAVALLHRNVVPGFSIKIRECLQASELFSLIATAAVTSIILLPVLTAASPQSYLSTLSYTDDNLNHLSLVKQISVSNGFIYGNNQAEQNTSTTNLSSYPQGWHLNVSILSDIIRPTEKSVEYSIEAYYFISIMWLGVFTFTFFRYLFGLIEPLKSKGIMFGALVSIVAIGGKLFTNILVPLFMWGSQPYFAGVTLLLSLLLILQALSALNSERLRKFYLAWAALLATGVSFVYYLFAPIALVLILTGVIYTHRSQLRRLYRPSFYWAYFALSSFFIVLPIIFYVLYFKQTQSSKFNEDGGTLIVSVGTLAFLSLLSGSLMCIRRKSHFLFLGIASAASFGMTFLIYAYQLYSTGGAHYYYHKAAHLLLIFLALMISALLAPLIKETYAKHRKSIFNTAGCILLLFAATLFALSTRHPLFDIYLRRYATQGLKVEQTNTILQVAKSKESSQTLFLGSCASYEDGRSMRSLIALSGTTNIYQKTIANLQFDSNNFDQTIDQINKLAKQDTKQNVYIFIDSELLKNKEVKELAMIKNIKFLTTTIEQPASCPLRLGQNPRLN